MSDDTWTWNRLNPTVIEVYHDDSLAKLMKMEKSELAKLAKCRQEELRDVSKRLHTKIAKKSSGEAVLEAINTIASHIEKTH